VTHLYENGRILGVTENNAVEITIVLEISATCLSSVPVEGSGIINVHNILVIATRKRPTIPDKKHWSRPRSRFAASIEYYITRLHAKTVDFPAVRPHRVNVAISPAGIVKDVGTLSKDGPEDPGDARRAIDIWGTIGWHYALCDALPC